MKLNCDTIQFESRAELGAIIHALEDWLEAHEDKDGTIRELLDKLDTMEMCW